MQRFFSILRKEFLQIRRDKYSLRMLFALPILQTLILGYAMTRDVRNISLGMVVQDSGKSAQELALHLEQNERFLNPQRLSSSEALRTALLQGNITIGIIIPTHFGQDLENATPATLNGENTSPAKITLLADGQDASSASIAVGYANAILNQWSIQHLFHEATLEGLDVQSLMPLELSSQILFNPSLEYSWTMVPGMLILLTTMAGALLTSFSLVRERENGTLEQLLVTPVHPFQVLLGKAIPYWILGQISFYLALAVTGLWYHLPLAGVHWGAVALGLALYTLTSVALGILVSTAVSSQQQALFLIWFFLVFFVLTSGLLLPFESMPLWMQNLTEFNAVRHFLYLLRGLLLRHATWGDFIPEYLKLGAIAALLFGSSLALFRRRAS